MAAIKTIPSIIFFWIPAYKHIFIKNKKVNIPKKGITYCCHFCKKSTFENSFLIIKKSVAGSPIKLATKNKKCCQVLTN